MDKQQIPCPCCSGKEYDSCCFPFHEGKLPKNALELMRSRYSAYVLNIPDYIIKTTHPASPQYSENKFSWKRSISGFSRNTVFDKLEILDFKEKGPLATVTFTAYITQEDHDATFTERSFFEKINDRWLYRGGQLVQGCAPNLVTTHELRLLPLSYFGEPILKKKAEPIEKITPDIKNLIEEMIETMDASNGIGLAAPQIHHSIRLFVIRTPIEVKPNKLELGDAQVFINPKLSDPSAETWTVSEGCLSIPTIRAPVERPKEITVEYTTVDGNTLTKRFSRWHARVIMHENDHLDGVLFVDRLDDHEKSMIKSDLQKLQKRIHDGREL